MKKKQLAEKMTVKNLIKEHKPLVESLKTGKGRKAEYEEQKQELKKYEKVTCSVISCHILNPWFLFCCKRRQQNFIRIHIFRHIGLDIFELL